MNVNSSHDTENETKDRARFFQTVQAWPLSEELNYDGWLDNFKTESDKKIACIILDFFIYYPNKMVDQMLISCIGQVGYTLSKKFPDWQHSGFKDRCIYSFIPGENPNPTDSGNYFTRKLRDKLGIPEERIVDFKEIPYTLSILKKPTPVIFVDDFVGSGAQCITAWHRKFEFNKKSLKEMSLEDNNIYIYAPLIVNRTGYDAISKNCKSLIISPSHIIGPEYNLFDPNCFCWKGDLDLYNAGVELILRKSKELGIPSTNGYEPHDEKGFGAQGLALAFSHGAPDAIPSFFYWKHEDWNPLIQKQYNR